MVQTDQMPNVALAALKTLLSDFAALMPQTSLMIYLASVGLSTCVALMEPLMLARTFVVHIALEA